MNALNTASYVDINKAMLSVCHVRQHIFSVYWIDLQADSDFSFRKSHKQLILVGSMNYCELPPLNYCELPPLLHHYYLLLHDGNNGSNHDDRITTNYL